MKSSVEPVEGNKVKVSVSIDAGEFESAIESAWKELAKEVKIPGFRAGKAPRKVLEQRIDPVYARSEALREAVPGYYTDAVREHEVDVIDQPEIDITAGEEDGDVSFDAVVEVRPEITISGYEELSVEIPSPHPSDDDVADHIDRMRVPYGELSDVERPAADGDHVTIDISGSADGEPIDGLTADDYLYEVGSGTIVAEIDDQLRGLKAADIVEFDAGHPDPEETGDVTFKILVKGVQERVLPDLNDEWVVEASEFATVDELRDDVITRLTAMSRSQAAMAVQTGVGEALAALVTDEVPEAMVNGEMQGRLQDMVHRLSHQGISLEQYLQMTGSDPQEFSDNLRTAALDAVKVDLALRAIATAEDLSASDDDVAEQIETMAEANEMDPDELREQLDTVGRLGDLRADIANRKALEFVTDAAAITDTSGAAVKKEDLEIPDDESDGDHDHDHDSHDHDH